MAHVFLFTYISTSKCTRTYTSTSAFSATWTSTSYFTSGPAPAPASGSRPTSNFNFKLLLRVWLELQFHVCLSYIGFCNQLYKNQHDDGNLHNRPSCVVGFWRGRVHHLVFSAAPGPCAWRGSLRKFSLRTQGRVRHVAGVWQSLPCAGFDLPPSIWEFSAADVWFTEQIP